MEDAAFQPDLELWVGSGDLEVGGRDLTQEPGLKAGRRGGVLVIREQ